MRTDVHFLYAVCIALGMAGCASKGKANAMSAASDHGASMDVVSDAALKAPTPAIGAGATALPPIAGLTRAVAQLPRRVPIRWSESTGTTYAWRIEISCDQGRGGILRNDLATPESFRGDGVFAGWSSAKLGEVYRSAIDSFYAPDEAVVTVQLD
jgi:hypothetical protein